MIMEVTVVMPSLVLGAKVLREGAAWPRDMDTGRGSW